MNGLKLLVIIRNAAVGVLLAVLTACDKVPMNGLLDGLWQITEIQTPQGRREMKEERAYLSFQLHLTQWNWNGNNYYAHFTHEGDSLFFYDFAHLSLHRTKEDNDEWITEEEMKEGLMDVWGIHNLKARYHILELSGKSLVLQKEDTILSFRKF